MVRTSNCTWVCTLKMYSDTVFINKQCRHWHILELFSVSDHKKINYKGLKLAFKCDCKMQFLGIYEHTTVWNVCVLNQFMVSSHGQYSWQNSIILLSKSKINNESLNNNNFRTPDLCQYFFYYIVGTSLCVWCHPIKKVGKEATNTWNV